MKVRINFTETSVRQVEVEVDDLASAHTLWHDGSDEAEDWINESVEHDGGVDWLSATFTVVTP
jgi:hypothetical protein